jgi:hypothetical protein
MWGVWLLSILLGPGEVDLGGQVVGTDYLQFYAAGTTLRLGEGERLYDLDYQAALEREIIGPELRSYHAFITPPFLAWLFVPLSLLPYKWSFALWSLVNLGLLAASAALLDPSRSRRTLIWALTWFPVFATVSFGQNSLLSLCLLLLAFVLWRRERPFLAGLVAGLILYKPQLLLGLGVLWLLDLRRSWRALAGLGVGGAVLAALSFGLLPEASRAYLDFALHVLPDLPAWQTFPLWHLHTVRGFWRLLLPGLTPLADALALLLALLGTWAFLRLWRRYRDERGLLFAAATCLTLWLTPHAMIYDWVLLLIPALLFWDLLPRYRGDLRLFYALIWLVTLVSSGFTYAQLHLLPAALQVSVPALALVFYALYRRLMALDEPPACVQGSNPYQVVG